VLVAFGTVTRFEPSVLRASAMAALSVSAAALGRSVGPVRLVALAVAAVVLVDPLLVRSVGFQLSVGASLAIAIAGTRLAATVPGPRVLAEALGVTIAAQAGVAPVIIGRFGGIPVVSLVTNVAAVPVAGLVTSWGLPAGVAAGVAPSLAPMIHLPTTVLIGWVALVARLGSTMPLGEFGAPHAIVLALVTVAVLVAPSPAVRRGAAIVVVVVLIAPALALRSPPPVAQLDHGVVVQRAGGSTTVSVPPGVQPLDVLGDLRRAGVRRIDVVTVPAGSGTDALVRALRHRWVVGRVDQAGPSP